MSMMDRISDSALPSQYWSELRRIGIAVAINTGVPRRSASNVVHEAFVDLYQFKKKHPEKAKAIRNLPAYFITVVKRASTSRHRRLSAKKRGGDRVFVALYESDYDELVERQPQPDIIAEINEQRELLRGCVSK